MERKAKVAEEEGGRVEIERESSFFVILELKAALELSGGGRTASPFTLALASAARSRFFPLLLFCFSATRRKRRASRIFFPSQAPIEMASCDGEKRASRDIARRGLHPREREEREREREGGRQTHSIDLMGCSLELTRVFSSKAPISFSSPRRGHFRRWIALTMVLICSRECFLSFEHKEKN